LLGNMNRVYKINGAIYNKNIKFLFRIEINVCKNVKKLFRFNVFLFN